jgi:hypothetical protein
MEMTSKSIKTPKNGRKMTKKRKKTVKIKKGRNFISTLF